MNPSSEGMFGAFIYFAESPEDCIGKAHAQGAMLCAEVDLGVALVCPRRSERLTAAPMWMSERDGHVSCRLKG